MKTLNFLSFVILLMIAFSFTSCRKDVSSQLNKLEKTWRNYEIDSLKLEQFMEQTTEPVSVAPYFTEWNPGCEFWFQGTDTIAVRNGEVLEYWNDAAKIRFGFIDGEDIRRGIAGCYRIGSEPHDYVSISSRKGGKEDPTLLTRGITWYPGDYLSEKDLLKPWTDIKKKLVTSWRVQVGGPFNREHHAERTLTYDRGWNYSFELEDFHTMHLKRLYTMLENISSKTIKPSLFDLGKIAKENTPEK
ncbi:MAG: hypothetical protein WCW29_02100 [Candidatus Paceibacterota bacterium]